MAGWKPAIGILVILLSLFNCSDLGGSSEEGKPGGVMVEFDDGDRGKISLHNIRLLPPGYQIHCERRLYLTAFGFTVHQ